MKYQIIVYGSVFYKTDDWLIARQVAEHYRSIGWKNVEVKRS